MALDTSPFIPARFPVALSRTISWCQGFRWFKCWKQKKRTNTIGQYDDPLVATGQPIERVSTWNVSVRKTLANFPSWLKSATSSPSARRGERERWYKPLWQLNQVKGRLMSQSGDLWTPHSECNPWHQTLINLPGVWLWWKLVLASVAALLEFSKKSYEKMPNINKLEAILLLLQFVFRGRSG